MGKRRPLVIRKNNFVLTKGGGDSTDSKEASAAATGIHMGSIGTTMNASGITRVVIQPLPGVGGSGNQVGSNKSKLNQTLHSNGSGNRALNNTQKIGRAG